MSGLCGTCDWPADLWSLFSFSRSTKCFATLGDSTSGRGFAAEVPGVTRTAEIPILTSQNFVESISFFGLHKMASGAQTLHKVAKNTIKQFGQATRQEINRLLMPKLSDGLDEPQRITKISHLLTKFRRRGELVNQGSDRKPQWMVAEKKP